MTTTTNTRFAVAVHVLTYLASTVGEHPVSSEDLSASTGTNAVYVRRVLGPLREAGLVAARPGAGGGWALARPAATLDLGTVWDVVHGDDPALGLHHPNPACPVGRGIARELARVDLEVQAAVRASLADRTVADLVAAATGTRTGRGQSARTKSRSRPVIASS